VLVSIVVVLSLTGPRPSPPVPPSYRRQGGRSTRNQQPTHNKSPLERLDPGLLQPSHPDIAPDPRGGTPLNRPPARWRAPYIVSSTKNVGNIFIGPQVANNHVGQIEIPEAPWSKALENRAVYFRWEVFLSEPMWTPLILFCMVADLTDCAIPVTPVARSEDHCRELLDQALRDLDIPDWMYVAGASCYQWPEQA